ncbi:MAG: SIR2 family protein [Balneolaceae bacterium]
MNQKALLVGNDINNISHSYSWANLIIGLKEYAKSDPEIDTDNNNKPFPLLYEEIYLSALNRYGTSENRIKSFIASQTRKLKPNEIHNSILDLGIQNIFTTNYDLTFEIAALLKKNECVNKGIIKESLYSVFRYHQTDQHKIWHIHGSETSPKTITLGYEHYSGYLQQMRSYVVSGSKGVYKKREFGSIKKRLLNNSINYDSWIDSFFIDDVFILGLNLDFVEMHLWWLLTYRARAKAEKSFPIDNNIVYFYPEKYKNGSKHKLQMFKANGVETIPVTFRGENKSDYYNKVIDKIRHEFIG